MREFQNPQEIRELLISGNFEELKGEFENEFFEAKSEPWDLDSERGKFELAKDLSSLANSHGGIIVIGATTAKAATYQRDEVQEIHPLPVSLAPDDRYSHIVADWIHPAPQGVDPKWYPVAGDPTRGLIGIYVPDQSDELRPFLVTRYIGESGQKISSVVGLVQRLGATTKPTPVHELHTFLREGRRLDEIHQKLDSIIAKLEAGPSRESRDGES